MMISVFLIIIVSGLCLFGFVFRQAFKGGTLEDREYLASKSVFESGVHLSGLNERTVPEISISPALAGAANKRAEPVVLPSGGRVSGDVPNPVNSAGVVPGGIFGEKCRKLEQLLEEKNSLIRDSEQALLNERAHRGEFENLKEILQRQIEDLKEQNRRLKEDLCRVLKDNVDQPAAVVPRVDISLVGPDVSGSSSEKFEQFFNLKESGASGPLRHDIFENKQKLI